MYKYKSNGIAILLLVGIEEVRSDVVGDVQLVENPICVN